MPPGAIMPGGPLTSICGAWPMPPCIMPGAPPGCMSCMLPGPGPAAAAADIRELALECSTYLRTGPQMGQSVFEHF